MSVAVDAACGCEDCSGLRDGLSALAEDGSLPDSLVHDGGKPIVVEVGDVSLTVAEARLRLALVDPNEPADEIRRAIARLREQRHQEDQDGESGRERYVAITDGLAEALAAWYAVSIVEGGADADGFVWPAGTVSP